MTTNPSGDRQRSSLLENWVSVIGIILAASSFFAVACLIVIDVIRENPNPYLGILTYLVAPVFLVSGLALVILGAWRERRRRYLLAPDDMPRRPRIDLNIPRHRRNLMLVAAITFVYLLMTALGSYQTYHFTESVAFCGKTCHMVMKPEFTAYQSSPHARVTCVQCHIGPGAGWFVKSKLSGSYQVYAAMADKFPRPIPTPIDNLRPAQETCEQCHWPKKFFGSVERVNHHYMADADNTRWTIRLLMKIGGGDPEHGPVGGIHWHMNIGNKVEYIATDPRHQDIPWVRVTEPDGTTTVYQSVDEPLDAQAVAMAEIRTMDCIDCHNRPSHNYRAPARAVNVAMATGRISPALPSIKRTAVELLTGSYSTTEEAILAIDKRMQEQYADTSVRALVAQATKEVQKIYRENFFPEMRVDWQAYPDNIGHTIFPGCYRCHDGQHRSSEGRVISHDCHACHTILAQGADGATTSQLIGPAGLEFKHPVDIGEIWREMNCAECHTGALAE